MQRRGEPLAEADGLLYCGGDVNGCLRIGLAHRGGDGFAVRSLVVRGSAYDGVERRRQRCDDLVGILVEGHPGHENPALRAMDRLEASDCLTPSGVWPTSITVSGSCLIGSRRP